MTNLVIDCNHDTVTFTWTYDNTVNKIPATSFIVTITPVNGGITIKRTVDIHDPSLTLPLNELVSGTNYNVVVVTTNKFGQSGTISNSFTSPGILGYLNNIVHVWYVFDLIVRDSTV